jgi:hypothetical protein
MVYCSEMLLNGFGLVGIKVFTAMTEDVTVM